MPKMIACAMVWNRKNAFFLRSESILWISPHTSAAAALCNWRRPLCWPPLPAHRPCNRARTSHPPPQPWPIWSAAPAGAWASLFWTPAAARPPATARASALRCAPPSSCHWPLPYCVKSTRAACGRTNGWPMARRTWCRMHPLQRNIWSAVAWRLPRWPKPHKPPVTTRPPTCC